MPELQAVRVQRVTANESNWVGLTAIGRTRNRTAVWVFFDPTEGAVELVFDDGVSEVGEVNSDLMLSAGDRLRFDQRVIREAFEDFEMRQC